MDLAGRRVVVTGASRGIGAAMARGFAGAGASVVLVARSEGRLSDLARDLGGVAVVADLAVPGAGADLVGRIEGDIGPIDVVVNNAGIDVAGSLVDTDPDELERLYQLNLMAPVQVCRAVLPAMITRGAGRLVNISSLAAEAALPGLTAYSSTKAGLSHFSASLRAELAGLGQPIGVTLVELGPVATDMYTRIDLHPPTQRAFARMLRLGLLAVISPDAVSKAVVAAVRADHDLVCLPRRAVAFPWLVGLPRRLVGVALAGVNRQPART